MELVYRKIVVIHFVIWMFLVISGYVPFIDEETLKSLH